MSARIRSRDRQVKRYRRHRFEHVLDECFATRPVCPRRHHETVKQLGRCYGGDDEVFIFGERAHPTLDVDQDRRVEEDGQGFFGGRGCRRRISAISAMKDASGFGTLSIERTNSPVVIRLEVDRFRPVEDVLEVRGGGRRTDPFYHALRPVRKSDSAAATR